MFLEGTRDAGLRAQDAGLARRLCRLPLRAGIRWVALGRSVVRAVYAVLLLALFFVHQVDRLARHDGRYGMFVDQLGMAVAP